MNNAFKKRCVDITHLVGLKVAIAVESFLSRIVFLSSCVTREAWSWTVQLMPARVRLCTPESIVLTCVLPYVEMCGFLWCYTALPLHFVDSNWPLWQLAALLTFCYLPRLIILIMTQKFARVGDDWLCVPVSAIAFASNVLMWSYPHNLAAVSVAICTTCTSLCPTVLRSLVYRRFAESGEWQRQRALRIFTLSDTFGYATAPFIGGVLYDHGGLRACAGFALMTSALWACCCRSA